MLWDGKTEVLEVDGGGTVRWMRLALAYFLLCRPSELLACESGRVHPDYCFGQKRPDVFQRCPEPKWVNRRQADKIEVCFRTSKAYEKKIGAVVTRTRV